MRRAAQTLFAAGALVSPALTDGDNLHATSSAAIEDDWVEIPPLAENNFQQLFDHAEGVMPLEHVCDGYDEEWHNCEGLPKCGPCTPANCVWGAWGDWTDGKGCSGLRFRSRKIAHRANHCGKQCEGNKEESEAHLLDKCKPKGTDCEFTPWSEWTACKHEKDQAIRMRKVAAPPTKGGKACAGSMQETKPCGGPKKHDCTFSPWQEWTSCSATCGEGRHTRMRRIQEEATNEGNLCWDMTLETAECTDQECPGQDCILSPWAEWSQCDEDHTQRYRDRKIEQAPKGGGKRCDKELTETKGCPAAEPEDCKVGEWTEWTRCDKTCGGGQMTRDRELISPAKEGGTCAHQVMKNIEPCSTQSCFTQAPRDCEFTQWSEWSACSVTCGAGSIHRNRKVAAFSAFGGQGCEGGLEELATCDKANCEPADCVWSMWEDWSGCSVTCGGGTQHRTRQVAVVPVNGGKSCSAEPKGEVIPCATEQCPGGCVDGVWGQWHEWSQCSGTCQPGYKSRRRTIEVHPNHCGKAPSGEQEEFVLCTELPSCIPDRDCAVSEWGEWSHCSCHCFGIRERNRYIAEFATGKGKGCSHGLKQIEPCNPGNNEAFPADCSDTPRQDCIMDEWTEWSRCSVSCGGGQMAKRRSMLSPSQFGGEPCESDLVITSPCNAQPCPVAECVDCKWGMWGEWSQPEKCNGQKYRRRTIERMPNKCGSRCEEHASKEVTESKALCPENLFCAWSQWSEAKCDESNCGRTTSMRSRLLSLTKVATDEDYLFIGKADAKCAGTQLNQSLCPYLRSCNDCQPMHCKFAEWGEWGQPTCEGLCERSRVITAMNNDCGDPCVGALLETKKCDRPPCEAAVDCILSDWAAWKECPLNAISGQRYRERDITQEPSHGGQACRGVLSETTGCNGEGTQSCKFAQWEEWGECSMSCGIGWHMRHRTIAENAHDGGFPCDGNMKELKHCVNWDPVCGHGGRVDCVYADWQEWTKCGMDGQEYRNREFATKAARGGEPCEGSMHETRTCELEAVDCRYSDWTQWDPCDRTCGKGQTHRHRQIHKFPQNGGKECPHDLMETQGCELAECVVNDCRIGEWTEWCACSERCGPGMQTRIRVIEQMRDPGGQGANGVLGEARECLDNPPCETADCAWDQWADWGDCSCTCGGGQRSRQRRIKVYPKAGGKQCDANDMREMEPCNTQICSADGACEDGLWGDWEAWAPCSASCDGGVQFRIRKIARMANECGCPPHGKDRQEQFCNLDVPCGASSDCKLAEWEDWSVCSATCDGIMKRGRVIGSYGRGNGQFCSGPLKEVVPCNPSEGGAPPSGCERGPRQDCSYGDWRSWSQCSATCGGGEHVRSRKILTHPMNGGKICDDALSEIQECARSNCDGPAPVDCMPGEWSEWGGCDKCSGERKRNRHILVYPANSGKECDPFTTTEVGKCPRRCNHPKYCIWQDWGVWTQCTATCGSGGKKRRRRYLHLSQAGQDRVDALPDHVKELMSSYNMLKSRAEALRSIHFSEVFLAFFAGCITIGGALVAVRCFSASRRTGGQRGPTGYTSFNVLPSPRDLTFNTRIDGTSVPAPNTYHHLYEANGTEIE